MELAVWGAEVAAVHAPSRARAARSTAVIIVGVVLGAMVVLLVVVVASQH